MNIVLSIFLGLFITFTSYFLIIWGLTSLYFWISHEGMDIVRDLKISASLAGVGLVSTVVGMVAFLSLNVYLFAFLLVLLSFSVYFATLKFFWKFSSFDAVVISVPLAIILNPAWLHLMGLI